MVRLGLAVCALWCALGLSSPCALAVTDGTITFDFTSSAGINSSATTGLFDPLNARAWTAVAPGGAAAKIINFGTGADGAFSNGPTQNGITVAGSTITVNTDVKHDFNFTSFNLGAGMTMLVTGSQALTIRALGTVTITGTISGDGAAGSSGSVGGTPGGGNGTASGGNGGNGSPANATPATAGTPISARGSGGDIGTNQNTGGDGEGGGGGCLGKDSTAADANPGKSGFVDLANAGACTSSRATIATAFETTFLGGAGGGGGGSFLDVGPVTYKGGAAGGGAGALHIVALGAVSVTGTISLAGGSGGAAPGNGAVTAGGGGGGSGGALWIQSLAAVSGAGSLDLSGGSGGDSTTVSGAATGGAGSVGIYRADTDSGTQSIATITTGSTQAVSTVSPATTGSYDVTSVAMNNGTGAITLGTPTETSGCGSTGTMTVHYEGSDDGVSFQNPVLAADIAELSAYKYIRFRATFTGANPPCLTGLSIPYSLSSVADISLKGGMGCASLADTRNSRGEGPRGPSADFWIFFGAWALVGLARMASRRIDL